MNNLVTLFILIGMALLSASFVQITAILRTLGRGSLRVQWIGLTSLIGAFVVGYAALAAMLRRLDATSVELIVATVLMAGGLFVLAVTWLFRQTLDDLARIAKLERDVILDPLTGAFNRRYLDARLEREVQQSRRGGTPLSVLLIDVDHFKRINDTYGHTIGDAVLRQLSALLAGVAREEHAVARYGGEEFVLVAPGCDAAMAADLGERVRASVEAHEMRLAVGGSMTVSIGISTLGASEDPAAMLGRADEALYAAKRQGRNRVRVSEARPIAA